MSKAKKDHSREIGLEIGSICGKYFLDLEHLHYGYWAEGLDVNIHNVAKAQDNYVNFLLSHIPEGVKSVLDVGCGSGHVSRRLLDKGYSVDCVSPSVYLSEKTREQVGDSAEIFECTYEQLDTDKKYDLILFSESFQYIKLDQAINKTLSMLNEGGHMLICDFFKRDIEEKSVFSGGHKLNKFNDALAGSDFDVVEDIDITQYTAPTIDLMGDVLDNVGKPVLDTFMDFVEGRHPTIYKIVTWKFRKQMDKIDQKYFQGKRTAAEFSRAKSYRLVLCKKK